MGGHDSAGVRSGSSEGQLHVAVGLIGPLALGADEALRSAGAIPDGLEELLAESSRFCGELAQTRVDFLL
jgi:hypothetical protein